MFYFEIQNRTNNAQDHIHTYVIGVGRFRKLGGGQGLEYWGAKGGPNSQQAHDVVMTSMRHNDVASTSFRRHVPTRFSINQCQIITFLISNQIKVAFIIIFPSTWYICDFFLFHIEIEGKGGWIIGGAKGYVAPPPFKLLGGGPLFLHLCMLRNHNRSAALERSVIDY